MANTAATKALRHSAPVICFNTTNNKITAKVWSRTLVR
jgi:hypothetical protein